MKFFAQQANCLKKIIASSLGEQTTFGDKGYTPQGGNVCTLFLTVQLFS